MTIDTAIKAFLNVTPDPVGTASRNYFHIAPDGPTQPYMVFGNASFERDFMTHCGPPVTIEELWTFTPWALLQSESSAIATTVRRLLNGYKGPMGGLTVTCQLRAQSHAYDPETKLHGEHLTFCLTYF